MKREAEILAGRDRVEDHEMIRLLRERRGNGEWIYTARTELAFHAGNQGDSRIGSCAAQTALGLRIR